MKRVLQWFSLKPRPSPLPDTASLPLPNPELVHAHHVNLAGDRHFLVVSHPNRAGFKMLTLWWDVSDWKTAGSTYWASDDGNSLYADVKLAEDALLAECEARSVRVVKFGLHAPLDAQPWLDIGGPGRDEGWLVGNPAGLDLLRRKAGEALEKGESQFDKSLELAGIRVVHPPPAGDRSKKWDQVRDAVGVWGCGLTVVVVLFLLLAGAYQIWTWLR